METSDYTRRDELVAERKALVRSLNDVRTLFVASFAEELPIRWEWIARVWAIQNPSVESGAAATSNSQLESMRGRAREVAESHLSGSGVWGHEGTPEKVRTMSPYQPMDDDARWTHVSPAIDRAEGEIVKTLDSSQDSPGSEIADFESGKVTEPLADLLVMYSQSFNRLQNVDRALARVNAKLPRPRPNVSAFTGDLPANRRSTR